MLSQNCYNPSQIEWSPDIIVIANQIVVNYTIENFTIDCTIPSEILVG